MPRYVKLPLPIDPLPIQFSKRLSWNEVRPREHADFFTFGYAGRSIEEILDVLSAAGVATVVDVRHTPVSMYKPEFSKNNLKRLLEANGFSYAHFPDLGVPREIRSLAIGQKDRSELWDWYDQYVVQPLVGSNLHFFFNFADHPIAFMCLEADPTACHRHRLALALERLGLSTFDL